MYIEGKLIFVYFGVIQLSSEIKGVILEMDGLRLGNLGYPSNYMSLESVHKAWTQIPAHL